MKTAEQKLLEEQLTIGTHIKIGKKYSEEIGGSLKPGQIIMLIKGSFDEDNGDYIGTSHAPSIWDEKQKDFDSIYHLFGNDLEDFMDCEILTTPKPQKQ